MLSEKFNNLKMNNLDKNITYTEAFNELQTIVAEIEQGEISIDELSQKTKRAALLIRICKQKLRTTEEDVNNILKEIADETKEA